ncbi:non-ribosomal peptide synthetase, partial [Lacrimispora sp.]|uniref:non-ribosomal peptide synthetase n=1 Tax=Lacrimispora sp. TaxID=2719234 RepID=UPI0028AC43E1
LPELRVQYKDFSLWQNKRKIEDQAAYWKSEFEEEIPVLDLKTDYVRPQEQSFYGATFKSLIEKETKEKVQKLAKEHKATEFMVMLSVFFTMLHKYSRQDEIIVGTPISGRVHADTHKMLGMFVNTLALKGEVHPDQGFNVLLKTIKNKCLKAYDNQEYPFEELIEAVEVPRDLSRNPLFDVMFVFQNNEKAQVKESKLSMEAVPVDYTVSKFDITFFVTEAEEGYGLDIEYCRDLFRPETIALMAKHYAVLLKHVLDCPDHRLKEISMLDEGETEEVTVKFNDTAADYPRDRTVAVLFEEQTDRTPGKIAAVYGDQWLTYEELNGKANRLAGKLRTEYGVKADDFIAVITERSLEMLVGLLAVIKAGAAYVPIDTSYPKERIAFILKDCSPKAVLVGPGNFKLPEDVQPIDLQDERNYVGSGENLEAINTAMDLIYMIYTSGTTGEPKGTAVLHRNVVRLVKNPNYICLSEQTRVLQTGAVSFDASTLEIWGPLLNGGSLYLYDNEVLTDAIRLKQEIRDKQINTLWLTAALYNQMVEEDRTMFKPLTYLLVGGEKLSEPHIRMLDREGSMVKVINGYGPTENTTFTSTYEIPEDFEQIPIGKPIHNTQVYILNKEELCGIGVPGELCAAGDGIARGYLNRPELSAEKFIKNPFGEGMMYRTGDLACWRPDGNIEYLGRMDEQIKIRGFRVELGEIESRLHEIKGIHETVVIAGESAGGGTYLCAYVVSDEKIEVKDIREKLKRTLPDYMIPSYVMQVERIPVTRNGKLDRRALPEPEYQSTWEYIPSRNIVEETVVNAFEGILGVKPVSVTDGFFDLGGDSIKAIRVVSKIREAGYQTSLKAIMSEQTPENIAKITKKEFTMVSAEQGEVTGEVKLTAIQRDFFEGGLRNPGYFNQSFLYDCKERVDLEALHKTLNQLAVHHDMLRAVYDSGIQRIGSTGERQWYHFHKFDCRVEDISEFADQMQSSINIEQGPLMRIGLFHTEEIDYLLVIIHHLVVDGVSWRILQEDLENGYRQAKAGKDIVLPAKTTSFKAWSESVSLYSRSSRLKREEEYWKKVLSQVESGKVKQDGHKGEKKTRLSEFSLNEQETIALVKNSNKAYNTEINDLMLTALTRAVNRVTGQTVVAIEMEGHGREEIGVELAVERTVGWFTSVYPAVFGNVGQEIGQDIREVKETLRRIPNKGIGYGILKNISRSMAERGTTADITFNYLGEFKAESDLFEISRHKHGTSVDPSNRFGAPISINGGIQNNVLSMGITYDESEYSAETMENLSKSFQKELTAVAMHCGHVEGTEYTASDYGETEWTEEEFLAAREKLAARGEEIKRIYPLTAMQEGMLFEKLVNERSTQYVIQQVMKFRELNAQQMQAAFEAVVRKHDILHTVIKYKEVRRARQVLLRERKPEFIFIEVSGEEEYQDLKKADVKRGFDLEEDTLIRMKAVKVSEQDYRLIVTNHHIIADGWCLSILYGDLFRYYQILKEGKRIPEESGGSYEQFIRLIQEKDNEKSHAYWAGLLENYENQAGILPEGIAEEVDEECIRIDSSLTEADTKKAEQLCRDCGVTINTLVEAAWGMLLQRYNRSDDVVFGKIVSGRNAAIEGIETMMGLFINLIPVRVQAGPGDTFEMLLHRLQKQAIAGAEHDDCSFAEIQSRSVLGGGLVETIMAFENYYERKPGEEASQVRAELESVREQTNYGITLSVNLGNTLNFGIEYETKRYGREEIRRILHHLETLLKHVIDQPQKALHEIPMID